MDLLGLLEAVLVLGILFGIVYAVVTWAPIPEPFKAIAWGVFALIVVIFVFDLIRGGDLFHLRVIR